MEEARVLLEKLKMHLDDKQKKEISSEHIGYEQSKERIGVADIGSEVNKNYQMDLSLKKLVNQYFLNYTYCCELFKKTIG